MAVAGEALTELVSVFGKSAAEGSVELAEGAEVGGVALKGGSEVVDEVILDGANAGSKQVEGGGKIGQEVQEGIKESQQEIKEVVQKLEKGEVGAEAEAKALESGWGTKFKNVWAGAKTFGKFVGVEIAKGALFYAGMKAVEALYVKLFPPSTEGHGKGGAGTAGDSAVHMIRTMNAAGDILQDALNAWSKWQAAHYDDRASYGSITVAGIDIEIFQILQSGISSLGTKRDKMTPLVNAAKKEKSAEAIKTLLTEDIAYAKSVVDLSGQISSKMTAMVNAGLPTKSAEVQAAYSMLVAASA